MIERVILRFNVDVVVRGDAGSLYKSRQSRSVTSLGGKRFILTTTAGVVSSSHRENDISRYVRKHAHQHLSLTATSHFRRTVFMCKYAGR